MQVVTMNGKEYLATELTDAEGVVTVSGATEICGVLTKAVVLNHLNRINVGEGDNFTLKGLIAYQVRDLTTEEQFVVNVLVEQQKLVKKTAIERVENEQLTDRVLRG